MLYLIEIWDCRFDQPAIISSAGTYEDAMNLRVELFNAYVKKPGSQVECWKVERIHR